MSSHGVAIVTGASKGIGRAIAVRLADDGFDVAVNDLPSAKDSLEALSQEIVAKGRRTCIVIGDVSVEADVQNIVAVTVEQLGEVNVVSMSETFQCMLLMANCEWRLSPMQGYVIHGAFSTVSGHFASSPHSI